MPTLRPSTALRCVRSVQRQPSTTSIASTASRTFSATARTRSGGEPQFDPPTGWLFGVKPGEKPEKEGWEGPFIYLFMGSMVVGGIALAFKPDTS
jgi:hypothetical protein